MRALPSDVVREASQRLATAAVVIATGLTVNYILDLVFPWLGYSDGSAAEGVVTSLAVGLSLLVWAVSRRGGLSEARLVDVGLVYEVLTCAAMALMENMTATVPHQEARGVSWVCLVIVLFPLFVPARPGRVVVASLLAALTGPLTLPLAVWFSGHEMPPMTLAVALFVPSFLSVGLAVVSVMVVHRLGEKVREARELGAWRLERMLGSGGMGEVWLATHRQLLTPAAIKLIRLDALRGRALGTAEMVQGRFRREAKAIASLSSPHTVTLHDFGQADDASLYYVMEMLDGIDLQDLVERFGPQPPARVVHILRQACESLQEAHVRQLIHRDIKPANLFVCRVGVTVDFVKVLDFGLVKGDMASSPEDDEAVRLTRPHSVFGTPDYMSPQQGMGLEIDARSDLYSLGCVAYWLLTGRTVFQAPTPMALIMEHLEKAPRPPSEHVAVPGALERIVMQCLEKEPAKRPSSAAELDDMLRACTIEVGEWTQEQARAWWDAHLAARIA